MQADTSRAKLRYISEGASFGVIPVAGNPNELRMTGESLAYTITKERSKEIRSDRQTTNVVPVNAGSAGGVNLELSYVEYDALLEAVLQGTWAVYGTKGVGTTFTADFAATTVTASVAPVGSSAFTTLDKGQWFKLTAPTSPNDGKFFKVSDSVSPTSTVITVDAATPLSVGSAITNCKVATSRLSNGVVSRSFTIEKEFNDVAQFFSFTGMNAGKLSLALASGQLVTGAFDFMGKSGVRSGATQLPGVSVASLAYESMNAVSGVGQIIEGGSLLTSTFIKSLSLDVDNHLRGRDAIGNLGPVSIGSGAVEVKGSMSVYLADGTLYDKFVNNSSTSLSLRVSDSAGNGYVITLPEVRYGDAKVVAGSKDQDAMIEMPIEAIMHATKLKTIYIDRVGVATP